MKVITTIFYFKEFSLFISLNSLASGMIKIQIFSIKNIKIRNHFLIIFCQNAFFFCVHSVLSCLNISFCSFSPGNGTFSKANTFFFCTSSFRDSLAVVLRTLNPLRSLHYGKILLIDLIFWGEYHLHDGIAVNFGIVGNKEGT